jgi:hypothetical protein
MASRPIDLDPYDHARRCLHRAQPGTLSLQSWLQGHWRGQSWGIERCERLGPRNFSLHSEGRALDWHLSVHVRADHLAADRLVRMLMAPDRAGNPQALASRMGVQELIWNCRYWSTGSPRMTPYSVCYDRRGRRRKRVDETAGHRDHVHIGLNWAGARKRTSFWRTYG